MSGTDQDSPVKRALLEIRRLREQLHRSERRFSEPIAIVGMGCRFPGEITDPAGFWDFLEKGGDAITEVPADRWDIDAYYDPDPDAPGKISTRWGGFLRGIDLFDPEFFGISAREAATLDPQQRLLLEVSWEALEDASIAPDGLLGSRTGVFTGMGTFDYLQLELKSLPPTEIDPYFATGGTHSVASGRISYLLGLKGPNVTVDTACSASLVAVHLACQSLRLGECDLGLAGGVSILLLPEMFVDFSRARMMAADGRCKVFDAAADGYVRAEGCGVVVLKRLSDAVTDGDRILALIRGSAINHDGRSNGLTAPNGPSQVAVIRNALEHAGVDPARVGYVEAHGTGTSLGDPIEVHALAEALGPGRAAESPLVIGSLKSNLGHLEAAAGIAGLMKIVLCLQHRAIPHSLHFSVPNPRIAWERLPVEVARAPREWPSEDPRVAGVSSFGFSGTNAHVLVEEYCPPEPEMLTSERPVHLLTVSAKSESALAQHCRRIASALRGPLRGALADAAFSLNTGRAHFPHRIAVMGVDSAQVAADLDAAASGDARPTVLRAVADAPPAVCFLFTGQGSQVFGIGRALYETEPAFRDAVHRCDAVLAPLLGRSITSVLYTETDAATRFTQPAIVTIELALTELWRAWGIRPAAVLGHSLGEYAAAIVASVLSVEDGLRLVAERARLVEERCVEGRMLAVGADADRTREVLATYESGVEIAALNGPDSVVVAGAVADVERSAASLERRGIRVQLLDTTRAFHHALLEPALIELDAFARTLKHGAPSVPMLSTLTGGFFEEGVGPTAGYWANQARRPVRFHDACLAAVGRGVDVFLEVGPAATLTGLARQALLQEGGRPLQMLTSLRRGRRDFEQMLESLAALHVCGAKVDWRTFDQPFQPRKCALPTYPFQRKRYWFDDSGIPGERRTVETKSSVHRTATELDAVAWTRSLSAARRQAAHVPIDLDLGSYGHRWRVLERLTIGYIVRTLRDLGLFVRADEEHRPADIVRSAAILPMYATLLERWLERLTAECLLERRGDAFAASAPLPTPDVEEAER